MKSILLLMALLSVPLWASSDTNAKVVFVSPEPGTSSFWRNYESMMLAAAKQLKIDLVIIRSNSEDRFGHISAIEKVATAENKPDYIVSVFKQNQSIRMLNLIEQQNIKFFATSSDVPDDVKSKVGKPRSQYTQWIGHLKQDDKDAGYRLMQALYDNSGQTAGGVVGFSGSRDSTVAFERNEGLMLATKNSANLKLNHIFFTNWDFAQARQRVDAVLKRFPDTRYFWCASDEIAAGVLAGIPANKKSRMLVGSIDWTQKGIAMVQSGESIAALGGNFAEGALILALIKDHSEGKDFAPHFGTQIPVRMGAYNAVNKNLIEQVILTQAWHKLDFNKLRQAPDGSYPAWTEDYGTTLRNLLNNNL